MTASLLTTLSTTALGRWSCVKRTLPLVSKISKINIFDFDNTLFRTPLPRRAIWAPETIGFLQSQDTLFGGGWWHDPQILASVGGGMEKMEPAAWEGWWSEPMVELAQQSISDPTSLTVLMTGRSEANFSDLIRRILQAKGLEFDLVVLKPAVLPDGSKTPSTADYKTIFFKDALMTYVDANVYIWEDRKKQAEKFNDYLHSLTVQLETLKGEAPRKAFDYQVHLVAAATYAPGSPDDEIELVTKIVNDHNNAIAYGKAPGRAIPYRFQSNRLFTGYILPPVESDRLKKLIELPPDLDVEDVRILSDNILASFHPPSQRVIDSAGGFGSWHRWRVVSQGSYNNVIWAVRVTPSDPNYRHAGAETHPFIVLCHKPRTKPSEFARKISNWQDMPVEDQIEIDTKFEDRVVLRVVPDETGRGDGPLIKRAKYVQRNAGGQPMQSSPDDTDATSEPFPALSRPQQDRHGGVQSRRGGGGSQQDSSRNNSSNRFSSLQRNGQGGRGRGRGGTAAGRGGGRGGGNRAGQYRSLDDAGRWMGSGHGSDMQY